MFLSSIKLHNLIKKYQYFPNDIKDRKRAVSQNRPNIFSIPQVIFRVKKFLYIVYKFVSSVSFILLFLYNIPSCIFSHPGVP